MAIRILTLLLWPGMILVVLANGIYIWLAFSWLKTGSWAEPSFGELCFNFGVCGDSRTGWHGIDSAVLWVFNQPISAVVLVSGLAIAWTAWLIER
jgi:hypothetical protein